MAAFDKEDEFLAEIERLGADLAERQRVGLAEEVEWLGGQIKEPGYRERMRRIRRGEAEPD